MSTHPRTLVRFALLTAALLTAFSWLVTDSSEAAGGNPRYGFSPGYTLLWESATDLARDLDGIAATGAGWVRVDFDWPSVQPTPSTWNWTAIDRVVSAAHARGLQVLALPAYTPAWARPSGTTDKHPPTDPGQFANFVMAAAARYAPQGVRHWEIWNEPNIVNFWQPRPDVAAYTRLLTRAAASIRAVDAGATVLTGGTSPALDNGTNIAPATFLSGIYANGGRQSFDAVAHHPYHYPYDATASGDWNALAAVTPALRSVMVANGDSTKLIWGTEYGAPTGTSSQSVSEAVQGTLIRDGINLWNSWTYTGPMFIYAWRDRGTVLSDREQNFGLVRYDHSAKLALDVFTELVSSTSPGDPTTTTSSSTTSSTSTTSTTIRRGNGRRAPKAVVGKRSTETSATALDGATVTGSVYIQAEADPTATSVEFHLDDSGLDAPLQQDETAPFELMGGCGATACPFDTDALAPGRHTLTVRAVHEDGSEASTVATFSVLDPDRCPSAVSSPFADVTGDDVHLPSIACLADGGLVRGTSATAFSPAASLTRGQAASLLERALTAFVGDPQAPVEDAFTDDGGSAHEPAMDRLAARGIFRGTAAGVASPSAPVQRGQLASYVDRAMVVLGADVPDGPLPSFGDTAGSVHEPAVRRVAAAGVAAGIGPGAFGPAATTTRAQAATFLLRLLQAADSTG